MNVITRGLWIEDSELTTAEIETALVPAYAVIEAAGLSPEQAHAQMLNLLETDSTPKQDQLYACAWMSAERALGNVGEHAVLALA